jgi:hypothetical protein
MVVPMVNSMVNSPRYQQYVDFMNSVPKRARVVVKTIFDCFDVFAMRDVVMWSRKDLHVIGAVLDFGFDIDIDELDIAFDALEIRLKAMGLSLRRHDEKARKIGFKHGSSLREPNCPPGRDSLSYCRGYRLAVMDMNEKYISDALFKELRAFWNKIKPPQLD